MSDKNYEFFNSERQQGQMELSGINKKLPKDTVHKISDNTGFH